MFSGTIDKVKSPRLDDKGSGFPPWDNDGNGGNGGAGGITGQKTNSFGYYWYFRHY